MLHTQLFPVFIFFVILQQRNHEMQTVLFHSTIFGPVHSRRLGTSLGVNLTPDDGKICSFDCLYCEAGFNAQGPGTTGFPTRKAVKARLEKKLSEMRSKGENLDVITFSGNGEPTLHPEFEGIIADTLELRNKWFPNVKVSVLSNSTRLTDPAVCRALATVDNNILKLDSAITETMRIIDRPQNPALTSEQLIERIAQFSGQCIVQTMMLRGEYNGKTIDNTTVDEVEHLLRAYKAIQPREIMLYSIDRPTPCQTLQKISADELEKIAETFRKEGFKVKVN